MFGKPADRSGAAGRLAPRVASLLGSDVVIVGDVAGQGELHLDGRIQGDVRIERLVIGESGRVEGQVIAEQVEIRGQVKGAVCAREIRLLAGAHVEGDLTHESLTIETGARFEGRSLARGRSEPALLGPPAEA